MLELARKIQVEDIALMHRWLIATPFASGFWPQKRIRDAIVRHADRAHGILLDIGCGMKPYEPVLSPHVDRYLGTEYSPESGFRGNKADFCGDAMLLPVADESLDTILCTEVLEHLPDPEAAIIEFARALRPGGTVITTAPFIYPVHDNWDFFRYSPEGIATMMSRHGFEIEKIEPLSGGGVAVAFMFNMFWFDFGFMWTKWLYPFGLLLRPLLLLLVFLVNILGWIADAIISSPQMSFNHLTIAKKK